MEGSKAAVGAAIGGNSLVMIAKFFAFAMTGSGAMLSEAIHTLADLLNQILLMVGIVRGEKEADEHFEYGYGRARFVWALISAVGIFFLGCGVTVYHGVNSLFHPHPMGNLNWAIAVLVFSLVVEGAVLLVAYRALAKEAAGRPFLKYLRTQADPSAVAVLLEDAAACLGVLVALACIVLTRLTGAAWWDSAGSIVIGLMLGAVAIWLIRRNKALLIGPSVPAHVRARVREILLAQPGVKSVVDLKTKVIDTATYDITATLEFAGKHLAGRLPSDIPHDQVADRLVRALGEEIDAIEKVVQAEIPEIKHLDIEPH